MDQDELIRLVADICEGLGIRYFLTGSIAAGLYGETRFTHDIDIVADLRWGHVKDFAAAFAEDRFYVSLDAIRHAIEHRTQFNIIDQSSFIKVDIMLPGFTPHDEVRFQRIRRKQNPSGGQIQVASPEDIILKKLVYYEEGHSEKHIRDVTSILRVQGEAIDRAYIEQWAPRLGVIDAWRMIVAKVDRAEGKS